MPSRRLLLALSIPFVVVALAQGCAMGTGDGIGGGTTLSSTSSSSASSGAGGTSSSSSSASSTTSSASSTTSSASSTTSASSTSSSSSTTSTSSSTSSTSSSTGGPCFIGHLLISEVRSRGAGGASDEFVELYNPTGSPVTLDSTWTLEARSNASTTYAERWTGTGKVIPAHGHFLLVGSAYVQTPAGDELLSTGITDATALRLIHLAAEVDAVCYAFSAATEMPFTTDATYDCKGKPASNLPHDNGTSAASTSDVSIERKPGGAGGNCTDTDNDVADFATQMPATPMSSLSPPTP